MTFRFGMMLLLTGGVVTTGFSQALSFNSPLPWVSLRNDSVIVRAQIDTAALKGKKLSMSLATVKNGRKRTISTKRFPLTDPSGEFSFGQIGKKLVGGREYLRVTWSVKGTDDRGTIEPIGIADLSAMEKTKPMQALHVAENADPKKVKGAVKGKFISAGKGSFAFAWNKKALFIVQKKGESEAAVQYAFDGKSGKNAFLSYPDRIVSCTPADSLPVKGIHFKRVVKHDSLKYEQLDWNNEITFEETGGDIVITVPWFDTGMIPFEERTIGFGVFVTDTSGKNVAMLPEKADFFTPATWGVLQLLK